MGAQTKKIGGSGKGGDQAVNQFVEQIMQLFGGGGNPTQSGQVGAGNPAGAGAVQQGQGAADLYQSLLSGGAGNIGGAIAQLMQRTQDRDIMKMKESARASGGAQFGTPGQYAEGVYRGEAAPNIAEAIGKLQMGAAQDIFKMMAGIYDKETPDADVLIQPSKFSQILANVGQVVDIGSKFFKPGLKGPTAAAGSPGTTSSGGGGTGGPGPYRGDEEEVGLG